jgi:hypothetical protein
LKDIVKIKSLVKKYNDVLMESMQNALSEDLINLIIVNGDDKSFELKDFIKKKNDFKKVVVKEFLKINSSSVSSELSLMEEPKIQLKKKEKI